jgi:glycine oxidase
MRSVDVAVIGGGVIGCAIAWRLSQRGYQVALFDRGSFGQEASWAAGGILSPNAEFELGPLYSLAQQSLALYPSFVKELQQQSDIDPCLLDGGLLSLAYTEPQEQHLREIHQKKNQWQSPQSLAKLEPMLAPSRGGVFFPDELSIDPRALFSSLLQAVTNRGVRLYPNTAVRRIVSRDKALTGIELAHETISCQHAIVASGSWSGLFGEDVLREDCVYPIRGQVLLLAPSRPVLSRVVYASGGYLVPRKSGHVLIGATSEQVGFSKNLTAGGLQFLLSVALQTIPSLQDATWLDSWSGLRPASKDGLPILGESRIKNLWFATGHYRNGILLTPITAAIISALLSGESPATSLAPFSAERFLR